MDGRMIDSQLCIPSHPCCKAKQFLVQQTIFFHFKSNRLRLLCAWHGKCVAFYFIAYSLLSCKPVHSNLGVNSVEQSRPHF